MVDLKVSHLLLLMWPIHNASHVILEKPAENLTSLPQATLLHITQNPVTASALMGWRPPHQVVHLPPRVKL
jgi:hypothetical protein